MLVGGMLYPAVFLHYFTGNLEIYTMFSATSCNISCVLFRRFWFNICYSYASARKIIAEVSCLLVYNSSGPTPAASFQLPVHMILPNVRPICGTQAKGRRLVSGSCAGASGRAVELQVSAASRMVSNLH